MEHKCPMCGKIFYPIYPEVWAYKIRIYKEVELVCSWRCLREHETGKQKAFNKPVTGKAAMIQRLIREGMRPLDVSKIVGCKPSTVTYWKNRM